MPLLFLFLLISCSLVLTGCGTFPRVIILQDPLTAEEHNDLGVAYEAKKEYDLAIREYRLALKKKEEFFIARVNLGNAYLQSGRYEEAEAAYKKAITLRPEILIPITTWPGCTSNKK